MLLVVCRLTVLVGAAIMMRAPTTKGGITVTTIDVPFASDASFALLGEHPGLAPAFALGQLVSAVFGDLAYRVSAGG